MDPAITATWRRRHKRTSRRLGRELRIFLPLIGVVFCFGSSATVIVAAESVPLQSIRPGPGPELISPAPGMAIAGYSMTSSNSTSKVSAAPAGIRPVLRLP